MTKPFMTSDESIMSPNQREVFLLLDEVPCNSNSGCPKFFWGGPTGNWKNLDKNGINIMMALKPIEEPFSRGLFKMVYDYLHSNNKGIEISLPENLPQLRLTRIYRCTQNISKFHDHVTKELNKGLFSTNKLNTSSCTNSPGSEFILVAFQRL